MKNAWQGGRLNLKEDEGKVEHVDSGKAERRGLPAAGEAPQLDERVEVHAPRLYLNHNGRRSW